MSNLPRGVSEGYVEPHRWMARTVHLAGALHRPVSPKERALGDPYFLVVGLIWFAAGVCVGAGSGLLDRGTGAAATQGAADAPADGRETLG